MADNYARAAELLTRDEDGHPLTAPNTAEALAVGVLALIDELQLHRPAPAFVALVDELKQHRSTPAEIARLTRQLEFATKQRDGFRDTYEDLKAAKDEAIADWRGRAGLAEVRIQTAIDLLGSAEPVTTGQLLSALRGEPS